MTTPEVQTPKSQGGHPRQGGTPRRGVPLLADGLLLVDKGPSGTSHDVVQQARRLLRQKKIGHCGTLDPAATGLLVLTVGKATRLTRFLIKAPKVYEGTVRFGISTDTYDAEGKVVSEASTAGLTHAAVAAAMPAFEGEIDQLPPAYSAKKVQGTKLYELARRGEEVPREAKRVTVYEFSPLGELAEDSLGFRLSCASGTYARSLAHDLGEQLGCGAHLSGLRRTSIGPFSVEQALTLDQIAERLRGDGDASDPESDAESSGNRPTPAQLLAGAWLPFDSIPLPFAEVTADPQQERRLQHGQTVLVREPAGSEGDWVKLINQRHQFVAVGTVIERVGTGPTTIVQPKVVFR
jgi:tRNA pseudouridine55 synthase